MDRGGSPLFGAALRQWWRRSRHHSRLCAGQSRGKSRAAGAHTVCDHGGGSTGGWIAASFSGSTVAEFNDFRAPELVESFHRQSATVFKNDLWRNLQTVWGCLGNKSDVKPRAANLREGFEERSLSSSRSRLLIPLFALLSNETIDFDSWLAQDDERRNFGLWEVVRAVTAAPITIDAHRLTSLNGEAEILGVDAGLFENSPEMLAISTVGLRWAERPDSFHHQRLNIMINGEGRVFDGGADNIVCCSSTLATLSV